METSTWKAWFLGWMGELRRHEDDEERGICQHCGERYANIPDAAGNFPFEEEPAYKPLGSCAPIHLVLRLESGDLILGEWCGRHCLVKDLATQSSTIAHGMRAFRCRNG